VTRNQPVNSPINPSFMSDRFFKYEPWLFGLLLAAAVLPIWSGRFFVTGDGPCHVYNAKVLLDFWRGRDVDFYGQFYFLNRYFDPNWFSHICLASLQMLAAPELAEKIFLTGYVLAFGTGFRFLLRQINVANVWLSALGLLYAWYHLLQAGFYNYACSFALLWWVTGFWLRHRPRFRWPHGLALAGLLTLLYSMHPIGLVLAGQLFGLHLLAEAVWGGGWRMALRQAGALLLSALPALGLFIDYVLRKSWPPGGNEDTLWQAAVSLGESSALVLMNNHERGLAASTGIVVLLLTLLSVFWRRRRPVSPASAAWLAFFGLACGQYFYQAGSQSVELLMPLRLQIVPFLALIGWLATTVVLRAAAYFTLLFAVAAMSIGLFLRIPAYRKASALAEEYQTCLPHLQPRSVVLVLNYDFNGTDTEGRLIGNRIWAFNHIAGYLGAHSTVVLSDNYEALRWYFPLIWHIDRDLFSLTRKDGVDFDHRPPRADLLACEQRTGIPIGQVLVLGAHLVPADHPYALEIAAQLATHYSLQYTSPDGRAKVYGRLSVGL
jgi:hypothetical protein